MTENTTAGTLVTFDGMNGSGKTTTIKRVKDWLIAKGYLVHCTKEVTLGTTIGSFVRHYTDNYSGNTLACLVAADRYEHIKTEILPKLKEGYIVLCDRYVLSSYVYQQMDGVDIQFIKDINSQAIRPDIQVLVECDSDIVEKRLSTRDVLDRFELRSDSSNTEYQLFRNMINIMEHDATHIITHDTSLSNENIDTGITRICELIIRQIK